MRQWPIGKRIFSALAAGSIATATWCARSPGGRNSLGLRVVTAAPRSRYRDSCGMITLHAAYDLHEMPPPGYGAATVVAF